MGKVITLLALLSAVIAYPAAAQNKPEALGSASEGLLVGTWSIVSVTTHVMEIVLSPQGDPETKTVEVVAPYGPNPKGRLILDRNGRFASILVSPNGPKLHTNDSDALAALAFESSFGAYSVENRPEFINFHFDAGRQPEPHDVYIEIKRLTASELEFETGPYPGGASYTSFVYRRAE